MRHKIEDMYKLLVFLHTPNHVSFNSWTIKCLFPIAAISCHLMFHMLLTGTIMKGKLKCFDLTCIIEAMWHSNSHVFNLKVRIMHWIRYRQKIMVPVFSVIFQLTKRHFIRYTTVEESTKTTTSKIILLTVGLSANQSRIPLLESSRIYLRTNFELFSFSSTSIKPQIRFFLSLYGIFVVCYSVQYDSFHLAGIIPA